MLNCSKLKFFFFSPCQNCLFASFYFSYLKLVLFHSRYCLLCFFSFFKFYISINYWNNVTFLSDAFLNYKSLNFIINFWNYSFVAYIYCICWWKWCSKIRFSFCTIKSDVQPVWVGINHININPTCYITRAADSEKLRTHFILCSSLLRRAIKHSTGKTAPLTWAWTDDLSGK